MLTQHEVFAAQTAREMLGRGDWVIPHFAGVPRLNKPPGMYYLIAGSMAAFQSRAEWVARLPAALAGVLTALLVARLTARWLGDQAGLVAGLMQATALYVFMQARLAEADMPMCAAVAVAMTAFAAAEVTDPDHVSPRRRALLAATFGTAAGLSVLLKGVGVLFVVAGCLLWVVATRRWRALRFLTHPAGLVPLVAVAGAWPAAAYLRDPEILVTWRRETFGRAGGEFGDPDPWYIYFWSVPGLLLPWVPFVLPGLTGWWRSVAGRYDRRRPAGVSGLFRANPRAAFLACWFAGGMTLLLLSQARHKHYPIPMLPAVTVVAAAGFVRWLSSARRGLAAAGRLPGIVAAVLAVLLLALAGVAAWRPTAGTEIALAAAVVGCGVTITVLFHAAGRPRVVAAACFGTALAGGLAYQVLILPRFDDYRASADLARRTNAAVPPGETVHLVRLGEAQLAYYLDRPLVRIDRVRRKGDEAADPLARYLAGTARRDLYVLCPADATDDLAAHGRVTPLDEARHRRRRSDAERTVLVRLTREP